MYKKLSGWLMCSLSQWTGVSRGGSTPWITTRHSVSTTPPLLENTSGTNSRNRSLKVPCSPVNRKQEWENKFQNYSPIWKGSLMLTVKKNVHKSQQVYKKKKKNRRHYSHLTVYIDNIYIEQILHQSEGMTNYIVYYISGTACTVIIWLIKRSVFQRTDRSTLWCAFQLHSISNRYKKHLTNLVFLVCTVSYGTVFFPFWSMAQVWSTWAHKLKWQTLFGNLQYSPHTRLVRVCNNVAKS